jgi:hypothetical protein
VSADRSTGEPLRGVQAGAGRMLRVETIFRVADESHGQTVAARLIDCAHEIANLPECQCDVDVSVEWIRSDDSADPGEPPASGRPAER